MLAGDDGDHQEADDLVLAEELALERARKDSKALVERLTPSWGATYLGQALIDALGAIENVGDAGRQSSKARRRIVLISDLLFEADEVFSALDHFRFRGHDLLILQVLDPVERSMPMEGMVRFHDLETGEELLTRADEIGPSYRAAVDAWLEELAAGCLGREVERAVLTTDEPPDRPSGR